MLFKKMLCTHETANMFFNVTFSEENEGRSKIGLWAINNTHVVSNRYE